MKPTWATLLSVAAVAAAATLGEAPYRLRIVHTNDMHARFEQVSRTTGKCSDAEAAQGLCYGGFARVHSALTQELDRARRENISVLSLNAGDTYQGTAWYSVYKWKVVLPFMKMLKIDAMALGNHEFDDGVEGLTPFLNEVGIPVLAANIDLSEEPEMEKTPIKSHLVFEKGGRKIGVIGYLTPDTVNLANPGKLKFRDEIEVLKEQSRLLKKMGVDIIIALGHSGYDLDLKIAAEVPDVDVIVGGHSHTFLYSGFPPDSEVPADTYPVMVTQKSGRKVAMVQAFAFTKYMGILDLTFDERGELLTAKGNPILLNNVIPEDPTVLREVKQWKSKLNSTMMEKIGRTTVLLDASLCRFYECNLGNLITDAYVDYAVKRHTGRYWTKAAVAIQQAGAIRASIDTRAINGTITREDLITTMPFFTPLSIVKLKGEHLLEALEWSVARYDPNHKMGRGEFLQVSGLRVTFRMWEPPGRRVRDVQVRCRECEVPRYRFLRPEDYLLVIMPTFLLQGGDNYHMFKKYGVEVERLHDAETEVVMKYVEEKGVLYDGVENRVTVLEGIVNGSLNLKAKSPFLHFIVLSIFWLIK